MASSSTYKQFDMPGLKQAEIEKELLGVQKEKYEEKIENSVIYLAGKALLLTFSGNSPGFKKNQ